MLFTVLPEDLGTLSESNILKIEKPIRETFTSRILTSVGYNNSDEDCFFPKAGYEFDVFTAELKETRHEGRKHKNTSPGINIGGISFKDNVKTPKQICVRVTSLAGCKECHALTAGFLQVDMIKPNSVEEPEVKPSVQLSWKTPVKVRMKENAVSQSLDLQLFDEIDLSGSAQERLGNMFVKIEPAPRDNMVYIRPQRAWMSE